ncbi:MAG: aminodeoxychorismate/anthranilate synthase component II [Akkermansia sp.]
MSQTNLNVWIIDHQDSFTYNLVELIRKAGISNINVYPVTSSDFLTNIGHADRIILSPGPGVVDDPEYSQSLDILRLAPPNVSILGICLGHQIIGTFFGAKLEQVMPPQHGYETTAIQRNEQNEPGNNNQLFKGIPHHFKVGLYHSWRLDASTIRPPLLITATDQEGHILGIQHKTRKIQGIQFHPESILTPDGLTLMKNFLRG